jgi:branched-chain amino acid aminotransferase
MLELLTDLRVDLARSAARHGEGLFETIRVRAGAACWLEAHLERLATGTRFLGLEPPPPAPVLRDFLAARTGCAGLASGVLHLLAVGGTLRVAVAPWAPPRPEPLRLGLADGLRRFSGSPLNRFKTLSYLENRLLAREAEQRGLFEVVALNEAGRLTDGSRTSLFLELDGRLYTPPVADGALPGVARRILLEAGLVQESPLIGADLARAESVLLANALRGALPVQAWPGRRARRDPDPELTARAVALLG